MIEDGDWRAFDAQPLPEPLAAVAAVIQGGLRLRSSDLDIGTRLLHMFKQRGLVDLDVDGEVRAMHGGDYTSMWWSLGIEHASARLVASGALTQEQVDGALDLVRSPDLVMISPVSIAVRGRVPR